MSEVSKVDTCPKEEEIENEQRSLWEEAVKGWRQKKSINFQLEEHKFSVRRATANLLIALDHIKCGQH